MIRFEILLSDARALGGVRQLVQQLVEVQAEMESGMIVDPPRDDDEKPIKQAAPPPKRLSIYEGEAPDGTDRS